MKPYPSIARATEADSEQSWYTFAKLDGSNLRFAWDCKKGWYMYGTRTQLLDPKDEVLGCSIEIFHQTLAPSLEKVASEQGWKSLIAFAEFWGEQSFAGRHVPDDPKTLTLIDVNPYKQGILGPGAFLQLFGELPNTPKYLGKWNWDAGFIQEVRQGAFLQDSFEGVVGKTGQGHQLQMRKAKTQSWIDRVRELYSPADADRLINS